MVEEFKYKWPQEGANQTRKHFYQMFAISPKLPDKQTNYQTENTTKHIFFRSEVEGLKL